MDAISGDARRELVRAVGDRYRAGSREEKRRILDEFVAVTRWHRKHAIRVLNVAGADGEPRRKPRARVYDDAIRQALLILCIRCANPVWRAPRERRTVSAWIPVAREPRRRPAGQFAASCSPEGIERGGGTVSGPNSGASAPASRRARVSAQYLGASSR